MCTAFTCAFVSVRVLIDIYHWCAPTCHTRTFACTELGGRAVVGVFMVNSRVIRTCTVILEMKLTPFCVLLVPTCARRKRFVKLQGCSQQLLR